MRRRDLLGAPLGLAAGGAVLSDPALAQASGGTLRVAMTLADLPTVTGQPTQGQEGSRFMGITLYDPLVAWDLSSADRAAGLRPALATEWSADAADKRVWTFRLRPGVRFHDGSTFDADAVTWNLAKLLDREAPQYDRLQAAQAALYAGGIASWRKIDAMAVSVVTKAPDAVFPYQLPNIFFSSPARWEASGRNWDNFAANPSGTGPFRLDRLVQRQRAELVRNGEYWDPTRIAKSDRLVLLPVPDGNARVAALLSGQVDWIEAPPPDATAQLRRAGMRMVTNTYPHIWPWQLSFVGDSPFRDLRVRQAANLAVDRDALVGLMEGLAVPAKGMVTPGHPWFGTPRFDIRHDKAEARRLLGEAGFSPRNPVRARIIIAPSGSGQMQPLPMNEAIQQDMREVGIDIAFEVLEWETLRGRRRVGADSPENAGRHGINNSWGFWDPEIGLVGPAVFSQRTSGFNWGLYNDPEADQLGIGARNAFDPREQDAVLARLHARIVDQAMWFWAVHDLNPRAISPKVSGFTQAQSWYQDLAPVAVPV